MSNRPANRRLLDQNDHNPDDVAARLVRPDDGNAIPSGLNRPMSCNCTAPEPRVKLTDNATDSGADDAPIAAEAETTKTAPQPALPPEQVNPGEVINGKEVWTLDQIYDNFFRAEQWPDDLPTTYSFPLSVPSGYGTENNPKKEAKDFGPFIVTQRNAAVAQMDHLGEIIAPNFTNLGWNDDGEYRFMTTIDEDGTAHAKGPWNAAKKKRGDIWVHRNDDQTYDLGLGEGARHTLRHEIGHVVGMKHPGSYDASDGPSNYDDDAAYYQDSQRYTVMSYFSPVPAYGDPATGAPDTFLLHDIYALQRKYGADMTTRTGDTTYGFNANTGGTISGQVYDMDANPTPRYTIWDAGGYDTMDFSGLTTDAEIDLRPGSFSSVGATSGGTPLVQNVSIAYDFFATKASDAWIERAIGGGGNDLIRGNDAENALFGHGGADTIFGGKRADNIYGGNGGDFLRGDSGSDSILGFNGGDTIIGDTGADVLFGEGGNDTIQGDDHADSLYGGVGFDRLYGGDQGDRLYGLSDEDRLYGGDHNDRLYGGDHDDSLFGDAGSDRLYGGEGDDSLTGHGGTDTFWGGGGNDTVIFSYSDVGWTIMLEGTNGNPGSASNQFGSEFLYSIESVIATDQADNISMSGANNRIIAGGGNDVIAWRTGGDNNVFGGGGRDTYTYAIAPLGVRVDLGSDAAQVVMAAGGFGLTDLIVSIERLFGSDYGDIFTGRSGVNNDLFGRGGNDILRSVGAGSNALFGGTGDDLLISGSGNESFNGGSGFDIISYEDAPNAVQVSLAAGLASGPGIGSDSWTEIEGLHGSSFSDQLIGSAGSNLIDGRGGHDSIEAGRGHDTVFGGGQNDSIWLDPGLAIASYNDTGYGGEGSDTIFGGRGNDLIYGGDDLDTLSGGLGNDVLYGGDGVDFADYRDAGSRVVINLNQITQNTLGAGIDDLHEIEGVFGSDHNDILFAQGTGYAWLYGGEGVDELQGGIGNDLLFGGDQGDTIRDALGNDIISGGTGEDYYDMSGASGAVTLDLTITTVQDTGGAGHDLVTGIEHLRGSDFGDTLSGTVFGNTLRGGDGNDTLIGRGGGDSLDGGEGDDVLEGGDNDEETDFLNGGLGSDTASYQTASSGVTVSLLAPGFQNTVGAGVDFLTSIENIDGSHHDDLLVGDDGDNVIRDFHGNDRVFGGAGNDTLITHTVGNDTYNGGEGDDRLVIYANGDIDIDLNAGTSSGSVHGNDVLEEIESVTSAGGDDVLRGTGGANTLDGGAGDDFLRGRGGQDLLEGGDGDDRLRGNGGADTLTGGVGNDDLRGGGGDDFIFIDAGDDTARGNAGADTFVRGLGQGIDTIIGFADDTDAIDLDLDAIAKALGLRSTTVSALFDSGAVTESRSAVTMTFGRNDVLIVEGITMAALENDIF